MNDFLLLIVLSSPFTVVGVCAVLKFCYINLREIDMGGIPLLPPVAGTYRDIETDGTDETDETEVFSAQPKQ